jgi:hypothetical protein
MTNEQVIELARLHIGTLAAGEALDPAEAALDLRVLEGMLTSYPAISRHLTRTRVTTSHTADENERVFNASDDNVAVTLPEEIEDSESEEADANGYRPPVNGAVVAVAGSSYTMHLYVEALGGWQQVNNLTLVGTFPLGPEHELGASYMLAARLAPSYRAALTPEIIALAEEARRHIDARFAQDMTARIDPALEYRAWAATGIELN